MMKNIKILMILSLLFGYVNDATCSSSNVEITEELKSAFMKNEKEAWQNGKNKKYLDFFAGDEVTPKTNDVMLYELARAMNKLIGVVLDHEKTKMSNMRSRTQTYTYFFNKVAYMGFDSFFLKVDKSDSKDSSCEEFAQLLEKMPNEKIQVVKNTYDYIFDKYEKDQARIFNSTKDFSDYIYKQNKSSFAQKIGGFGSQRILEETILKQREEDWKSVDMLELADRYLKNQNLLQQETQKCNKAQYKAAQTVAVVGAVATGLYLTSKYLRSKE